MKKLLFVLGVIFAVSIIFASAEGILVRTDEKTAKDITKNPFMLYFNLGKYYFEKGDFTSASSLFLKSAEIKPDFKEAYYNLGISEYKSGDVQNAIENINKAIELDEKYSKPYYSLGLIYYYGADYDNAILNLKKAVEIENSANENFDLAVAYADRFRYAGGDISDLKKAVSFYEAAELAEPGFSNAKSNAQILKGIISDLEN